MAIHPDSDPHYYQETWISSNDHRDKIRQTSPGRTPPRSRNTSINRPPSEHGTASAAAASFSSLNMSQASGSSSRDTFSGSPLSSADVITDEGNNLWATYLEKIKSVSTDRLNTFVLENMESPHFAKDLCMIEADAKNASRLLKKLCKLPNNSKLALSRKIFEYTASSAPSFELLNREGIGLAHKYQIELQKTYLDGVLSSTIESFCKDIRKHNKSVSKDISKNPEFQLPNIKSSVDYTLSLRTTFLLNEIDKALCGSTIRDELTDFYRPLYDAVNSNEKLNRKGLQAVTQMIFLYYVTPSLVNNLVEKSDVPPPFNICKLLPKELQRSVNEGNKSALNIGLKALSMQ